MQDGDDAYAWAVAEVDAEKETNPNGDGLKRARKIASMIAAAMERRVRLGYG